MKNLLLIKRVIFETSEEYFFALFGACQSDGLHQLDFNFSVLKFSLKVQPNFFVFNFTVRKR